MDYIHSKNVVHRDIKPSNILRGLVEDEIRLSDFGFARNQSKKKEGSEGQSWSKGDDKMTLEAGTRFYAAPELVGIKRLDLKL